MKKDIETKLDAKQVEEVVSKRGYKDFKWIDPADIVVSQWVRMKCFYGCNEYGNNCCCPPNVPTVNECQRFLHDYKNALLFHFQKRVEKPEDRHSWTKKISLELLELEREIFLIGYEKTFLLFLDSCHLCDTCGSRKEDCLNPKMARPTPEAFAIDVFSTVRHYGYPIEVLSDYSRIMNRYAFLLIS